MSKKTLEYIEKHHILEVDGIEYEIPQRTPELEEKIREHDANLPAMTEYEGNMSMLRILFGDENAERMFPDKENTNLDKLLKCTNLAIGLFMLEYKHIQGEKLAEDMKFINNAASHQKKKHKRK